MALQALGLNDHWQALFDATSKSERAILGRVVRQDRGFVLVSTENAVVLAAMRPKADPALVGDWVAVEDEAVSVILERNSLLGRRDPHSEMLQPIVANVDVVFVVCGMDRPVNLRRIERALTQTQQSGAVPVVVLSKIELVDDGSEVAKDVTAKLNVDVCTVSSHLDQLDEIRTYMRDKTSVLVGESGAGKSTIVNALLGEEIVLTGEVRGSDAKGRHTTTRRELHLTSSGILIDTPGIRALGLWADEKSVAETFSEIAEIGEECHFSNCEHQPGTPGCAIQLALEAGEIDKERVDAWMAQVHEVREREAHKNWRRYKS